VNIAAGAEDDLVESAVEVAVLGQLVGHRAAQHPLMEVGHFADLLGGDARSRVARGHALDEQAAGVEILDVFDRELDDPRAPIGNVLEQPLGGELLQRLADRHLTDALLVRDALLAQPLARLDASLEDVGPEPVRHMVGELLVGGRLLSGAQVDS
jgi:hypothetical protein